MEWVVCFGTSITILIAAVIISCILMSTKYRRMRVCNSFNVLISGVFLSSIVMFIPAYLELFAEEKWRGIKAFLLSLHNTFRLFILDVDFDFILSHAQDVQSGFGTVYTMYAAFLFVLAPLLTFGVVLSFFKNIFAYLSFLGCFFSDVFIFSDLNPKSIALAKSLKANNPKRTLIFTNVYEVSDEDTHLLIENAHELGAIIFKKSISDIGFHIHSKRKSITFFVIDDLQSDNMKQSLNLIEKYKERENVSLYVFATGTENELPLSTVDAGKIKVRRIDEIRSLINRHLYDEGNQIFEHAISYDDKEKMISALVLGMGNHGMEMAKALPWFCQMDGYRLYVNIFDKNCYLKSYFEAACPELMDDKHNKDFTTDGEAHYSIDIYDNTDVETIEFWKKIKKIPKVTYVFVALGDDEINIRTAAKLRSWFEKEGAKPRIDVLVRETEKAKALQGIKNYSGQEYNIHFFGDLETSFSETVILNSELEEMALKRHKRWGAEEDFWKYEYNYQSSIASVIHQKAKNLCGISGIDKNPDERNEHDKWAIRILEHRRWNAYMRAEGYVFAEKRNNLAKTHPCLVKFADLSLKEQEKDDD